MGFPERKHCKTDCFACTYIHGEYFRGPRAEELCASRGGRPGLPVPNSPHGLCGRKATLNCGISELRSCVKVEADALESPSLIVLVVSVDVKQH